MQFAEEDEGEGEGGGGGGGEGGGEGGGDTRSKMSRGQGHALSDEVKRALQVAEGHEDSWQVAEGHEEQESAGDAPQGTADDTREEEQGQETGTGTGTIADPVKVLMTRGAEMQVGSTHSAKHGRVDFELTWDRKQKMCGARVRRGGGPCIPNSQKLQMNTRILDRNTCVLKAQAVHLNAEV